MPRLRPVAVVCSALLIVAAATAAHVNAEVLRMAIDRPTALGFLRAAMPYTIEVGAAGLMQRFRLSNPRNLIFEKGQLRLSLDCAGAPIPFDGVVEPVLAISFDPRRGAWVVRAESLPVILTGIGTIQLDQFVKPFVLPVVVSTELDAGVKGLSIDLAIRALEILPDRIELRADMAFRPPEPPRAAPSGGPKGSIIPHP